MGNLFISVPAPAGNGSGAAVDFSAFGALKTIIVGGTWDLLPTINIEVNNNAVATDPGWTTVATFQGEGSTTLSVGARWMRATVSNFRGGSAPVINIGGDDSGTTFATLVAPAGDGDGAAVNTSALGEFKSIQVVGTYRGSVVIEISNDGGTTWGQQAEFTQPGIQSSLFAADFMRVSRNGVPGVAPGLPIVNIGACVGPGGGGGGGPISFDSPITPPALAAGVTSDYAPAGLSTTNWIRQAVDVAGSTLDGLVAQSDGAIRLIQNLGTSELVIADESTSLSAPANQFVTPDGQAIVLPPGGTTMATYDATLTRWILSAVTRWKSSVDVRDFGAVGDGVTDDRAAFQRALAVAIDRGLDLTISAGRYLVSRYIDIANAIGVVVRGVGSPTIVYPSDDPAVVADGIALTNQQARSAMLVRSCQCPEITGIRFEGGNAQEISTLNIGCGIYATKTVNPRVHDNYFVGGYGFFYQDSQPDTSGQGDSIAVVGSTATLTDASALFRASMVGRTLTIGGSTNQTNNGTFLITRFVSTTQIEYTNASAITEVSAMRWMVDDHDQGADVSSNLSYSTRGYCTLAPDTVFSNNTIERPGLQDATGIGNRLAIVGTTVTLTCALGGFLPTHDGKYIAIAGATSPANNGTFRLTYISATQVSFTNAAGVSEVFSGTWWIQCGDTTGIGAGVGGLAIAGTTVTLTASVASFAATDVGKLLRIRGATTPANNGPFVITAFVSPTQVQFENALGVSEAYSGLWATDAFDNGVTGGNTYGSTHGIYLQSGNTGRRGIIISENVFKNIRTTCVKWSGSAAPLGPVSVSNNYAEECGALFQGGADDSQIHTAAQITDNILRNVSTGRQGWNQSNAISFLGARGVTAHNNQFNYSRNAIGAVSGAGIAELTGIEVGRVLDGQSQPVSDVTISENKFTANPAQTTPQAILLSAIRVRQAGQLAKWGTGGSFTKAGNVMTLTAGANRALFSQEDVGKSITLVFNADAGNDGTFTIETVVSSSVLTYTNAAGVGGGAAAGTWRIPERSRDRGSGCAITNNRIINVGESGITTTECVGPEIKDNTFAGLLQDISLNGDVAPRVTGNREVGIGTLNGHILIVNPVTWPYFDDNVITNNAIGVSSSRMMDIAVGAAANRVDYPLCGKRGRCRTADARNQVVIGYGSKHVDGDTITVDGVTYTFKTAITDPATQYNSFATLVALIDAQANMDCQDYGHGFHFTEDGANGIGGDIVDAAGTTTLTVTGSPFTAGMVGRTITVKNATSAGNEGVFVIASFIDPDNITYANPAGVTETVADLQWFVAGSVDDIDTQHMLIQAVTPTTTDASLIASVNTLNPTALVMPRNATSPNTTCRGVGFGAAGPTAVTSVAWSLAMTREGGITVWADNAVGQNLLQANGFRPLKPSDGRYSGACEVFNHGESMGTEEFRWALA